MIVKADRTFFCKLFVIARSRGLDLYDVYSYELGPVSWVIATPYGTLNKSTKSDHMEVLEKDIPFHDVLHPPGPGGAIWIIDAFANIQILVKFGQNNRNDDDSK